MSILWYTVHMHFQQLIIDIRIKNGKWRVQCIGCFTCEIESETYEEAVRKWSTRYKQPEHQKKPLVIGKYEIYKCPLCHDIINLIGDKNHCWNCGQKIDWSE